MLQVLESRKDHGADRTLPVSGSKRPKTQKTIMDIKRNVCFPSESCIQ